MRAGSSFYLAAGIWILFLVLIALESYFAFLVDWHGVPNDFRPTDATRVGLLAVFAMGSVGALVVWQQPRNRIGWLLTGVGLSAIGLELPKFYAGFGVYIHPGLPATSWSDLLSQIFWVFLFVGLLVLLPLLFPDGRLLSPRWRFVLALAALAIILVLLYSLDPSATTPLHNPIGVAAVHSFTNQVLPGLFSVVFLTGSVLALTSLAVRFRRGGEQQRQQIKWLLVAVLGLLLTSTVELAFSHSGSASPVTPLMVILLPVAIGIAILRYRLYDIDLIINKALVYGGLAAVITVVYILVVVNIGALVGGSQRLWLSLVTTAIIAIGFQPLRARAQRLANRLVYGKRATPYETLSQLSAHLAETSSQDATLDQMSRVLAEGTGAERAEIWVRAGSRLLLASSSSPVVDVASDLPMRNGTLPELARDTVVPVSHQGELLGALAVVKKRGETMNSVEQKLVTDLAGQAGLVLKNVGLNRELLARLDDLRASRQRLVAAQDEERRRIERDLHDGAQQNLVALKMRVGLAEAATAPDSRARPILAQLKHDADEAIDRLRELARGVYPPLLASDGLEVALRAHLRRLTLPAEIEATSLPRQAREVEGAIYFCCLEALQNVAKYAQPSQVIVRLRTEASSLVFEIADDGKGFDPVAVPSSSGLQNMRDRLEALGGSFAIRSAPGKGTTVEGRVPLGP